MGRGKEGEERRGGKCKIKDDIYYLFILTEREQRPLPVNYASAGTVISVSDLPAPTVSIAAM